MVCLQIEVLEQYVTGTTDVETHAGVSAHLTTCATCRALLDDVRANVEMTDPVRRAMSVVQRTQAHAATKAIGSYSIIREIGRGGTGIVYEAQQSSPSRRVAIKLLNVWASDDVGRRLLQREAEALARVRHPGVAAIHDAGVADDGRSYLVMELVDGSNLLAFADTHQLDLDARLKLFVRVCDAVAAAHRRGVIHRDLKPSNILVEADGTPRVLDFGLAKFLERDTHTSAGSIVTDIGRIVGTIPYMSPEQIRGRSWLPDLDLSTDVYSLGVVLFELLTGALPYTLDPANLPEAAQLICEEPPIRPSRLRAELRGELETILLKALEKSPERRYASAAELRDDLERFLARQPIAARPPTFGYQLRKLVARHRLPFALAGLALVVLVAFAVTSTLLAMRLADQTAEAVAAQRGESHAREEAERQRAVAEAVNTFLVDTLGSADPWRASAGNERSRERTVTQALATAAETIDAGAFDGQPEIEAAIRHAIGDTLRALGQYDEAEAMLLAAVALRRELHPDGHANLSLSLNKLARVRHERGDMAEAEALYREALAMRERLFGSDHEETATILNNLGVLLNATGRTDEAEVMLQRALRIRRSTLPQPHSDVATTINNLAILHYSRRDYAEAERLMRESLAIDIAARGGGPEAEMHPNVVTTMNNIAMTVLRQDRADEAVPMLEDVLDIRRRTLDEHPLTAQSLFNLASALHQAERFAEALPVATESVAMNRAVFREPHRQLAGSIRLLAAIHEKLGNADEAAALAAEADAMDAVLRGETASP